MTDKYSILGLKKKDNPDEKTIKKAYKKMALKWHPDRNRKNKDKAEEKFKEINEAYEILSDSKKKELYDNYGENGIKGNPQYNNTKPFTFSDRGSPFKFNNSGSQFVFNHNISDFGNINFNNRDDILGTLFGNNNNNIIYKLKLTLEQLATGIIKNIKITDKNYTEILKVKIKPGWKAGTKLTYNLKNNNKVEIIIKEIPHKYYIREGNNLRWVCKLTKTQVKIGVKLTLPKFIEKLYISTSDKYITHGTEITINNKGMPIKGGPNRGDIIIEFHID